MRRIEVTQEHIQQAQQEGCTQGCALERALWPVYGRTVSVGFITLDLGRAGIYIATKEVEAFIHDVVDRRSPKPFVLVLENGVASMEPAQARLAVGEGMEKEVAKC